MIKLITVKKQILIIKLENHFNTFSILNRQTNRGIIDEIIQGLSVMKNTIF